MFQLHQLELGGQLGLRNRCSVPPAMLEMPITCANVTVKSSKEMLGFDVRVEGGLLHTMSERQCFELELRLMWNLKYTLGRYMKLMLAIQLLTAAT